MKFGNFINEKAPVNKQSAQQTYDTVREFEDFLMEMEEYYGDKARSSQYADRTSREEADRASAYGNFVHNIKKIRENIGYLEKNMVEFYNQGGIRMIKN
jgi:hypothetical protein